MQSRKINTTLLLVFLGICFLMNFYYRAFALDTVGYTFSSQSATENGSNNSVISVGSYLEYINKGDNSSVIGNYFQGYYFDSVLGFFKTDWSVNQNQNVRIISSTSKCNNGYGYKLGGYAYSNTAGFIDFDYNQNIFVYYCVEDKALYGHAYSRNLGFQNFQGISFDINKTQALPAIITGTGFFTNDTSSIKNPAITPSTEVPLTPEAVNSNFTPHTIQGNTVEFESLRESLFYIIK